MLTKYGPQQHSKYLKEMSIIHIFKKEEKVMFWLVSDEKDQEVNTIGLDSESYADMWRIIF